MTQEETAESPKPTCYSCGWSITDPNNPDGIHFLCTRSDDAIPVKRDDCCCDWEVVD